LRMRGLFNDGLRVAISDDPRVSIRLADAWPFQPRAAARAIRFASLFQSALRMRGLFNGHESG